RVLEKGDEQMLGNVAHRSPAQPPRTSVAPQTAFYRRPPLFPLVSQWRKKTINSCFRAPLGIYGKNLRGPHACCGGIFIALYSGKRFPHRERRALCDLNPRWHCWQLSPSQAASGACPPRLHTTMIDGDNRIPHAHMPSAIVTGMGITIRITLVGTTLIHI